VRADLAAARRQAAASAAPSRSAGLVAAAIEAAVAAALVVGDAGVARDPTRGHDRAATDRRSDRGWAGDSPGLWSHADPADSRSTDSSRSSSAPDRSTPARLDRRIGRDQSACNRRSAPAPRAMQAKPVFAHPEKRFRMSGNSGAGRRFSAAAGTGDRRSAAGDRSGWSRPRCR
jgi:hypothetical protein